jgi:hypothetical protein
MRKLFLFFLCLSALAWHACNYADSPWFKCEKKWGEAKFQGKRIVRYRLRGGHFPQGQRFLLIVKWFNGEEAELFTYVANRKGYLILEEDRRDDPIYALCPLKKGERVTFVMRTQDNASILAETSVVPFPNSLKTESGVKLSLELQSQEGDAFCLLGKGLDSEEPCEMVFSFQGKEYHYFLKASSEGRIYLPFTFALDDIDGGGCFLTLQRKNEKIILPFYAGRAASRLVGGFALEIR